MDTSRGATLLVPPSLRFFLPPRQRGPELEVRVDGTSTAGHLLSAAGVPRTEVGGLLLDGHRVEPEYRPRAGDRISVLPIATPQPAPTSPPQVVLDVHLGTLARRMRLLGLDTSYDRDADDEALLERSLTQRRVLLTRDRGLLHRRALRWGAHVDHQVPDEQLREVLDRFAPSLRPWTRCPACNGMLRGVAKSQVQDRLPAGTRLRYQRFRACEACGQVYWRGAHGSRLHDIVEACTGSGSTGADDTLRSVRRPRPGGTSGT